MFDPEKKRKKKRGKKEGKRKKEEKREKAMSSHSKVRDPRGRDQQKGK